MAGRPYSAGQCGDAKIHDTQFKTAVPSGVRFPADYSGDAPALFAKIVRLFEPVGARALSEVKIYPESFAAFEIYGADIVVDSDNRPWLIEVNNVSGMPGRRKIPPSGSRKCPRQSSPTQAHFTQCYPQLDLE